LSDRGFIFNIQKFSIHDGPGIRTVVFYMGCPLNCLWCSNPESQNSSAELLRIAEGAAGAHLEAVSLSGKEYSLEEVMELCLQDREFYEESGGGVTLSGGEALSQSSFVIRLLDALGGQGIHRALETTGFAPPETFAGVISRTDLLLFDIKHHDSKRHREGAGVDNDLILANLKFALEKGVDILPRIPVIPGYNDALTDAEQFSALRLGLGLKRVQLLPFHQFGEKKYETLQKPYTMKGIPNMHREDLQGYREVFIRNGMDCFF
jgi:pyruvate formate lyase activating enzyme